MISRATTTVLAVCMGLILASCGGASRDMSSMSPGDMQRGPTTGTPTSAAAGLGLMADENGYKLEIQSTGLTSTAPQTLRFRITTASGPQREFAIEQTKLLHLIVVHRALIDFQHVHPTLEPDGVWSVPLTFSYGGDYRVIADFTPIRAGANDRRTALGIDVSVGGAPTNASIPMPSTTTTVDGYTISYTGSLAASGMSTGSMDMGSASMLTFTVSRDGQPVRNIEPYLGAYGHLVALRAGDVAYTHLHAIETATTGQTTGPTVGFMADVPGKATYRLFLQFQIAGTVHTAGFTVAV